MDDLGLVIDDLGVRSFVLDEGDDRGKNACCVALVVRGVGDPKRGDLPGVVVVDFCGGYVELIVKARDERFEHLPLSLERMVLRQTQLHAADADGQGHGRREKGENGAPALLHIRHLAAATLLLDDFGQGRQIFGLFEAEVFQKAEGGAVEVGTAGSRGAADLGHEAASP